MVGLCTWGATTTGLCALPESTPGAAFEEANRLYERGLFAEAAQAYDRLLQQGFRSAAVLYNRGNAFFKAGQLGRSIASYREALALAPRDMEIRTNLRFARDQVRGPTLQSSAVQDAFNLLTLNEWTALAVVPFWITILLSIVSLWQPLWHPRLRPVIRTFGSLTLILATLTVAAAALRYGQRLGVVIAASAPVRNGPFEESPVLFQLSDGAEIRIIESKEHWFRIQAGSGQSGWIHRDHLTTLTG
ncbi:MAG: SH3 domain-containing protein [Verrucomicrobiota bacterium]|nr:SH3 domain-containing protein [Limisphaera sp.]MDW8382460.1 SH3 domain-containing protein [Verrucomicrobiota bacterium]